MFAPRVAAFLSAIFPNIKSIPSSESARVFEDDEDEDEEGMEDEEGKIRQMKWRQVNELLPIFRFVRVQESRGRAPRGAGGKDASEPGLSLNDEDWDTDFSDL